MSDRNIASVSWGDHVVFGDGDGNLRTADSLKRRLDVWRDELGCGVLHWRVENLGIPVKFHTPDGSRHPYLERFGSVAIDEFMDVPDAARDAGLQSYLYVTLFDEGWPLPPAEERAVSYHNDMHCQHVSIQTQFCADHPEFMMTDREGNERQWGVVCLAYEEVRQEFTNRFCRLITDTGYDGLFVCLRSQSRPPEFADQFGYNEPVRQDYAEIKKRDIDEGNFDEHCWRQLLGSYLTSFLEELRAELKKLEKKLAVGGPRGDTLGPPLGNGELQWRDWAKRHLVDQLVIEQSSSRCPSIGHNLWPMHRGGGYVQNYIDGSGMPPLLEHLADDYSPVFENSSAALYVARQWAERDEDFETALTSVPGLEGLVFSTFRHDNPEALARGDWRY